MAAIKITNENYDSIVTGSSKPVVMDFWAEWCPHCRRISSMIDNLADEYSEKVIIGKVNVDENEDLGKKFEIESIPSLVLMIDNKVINTYVGPNTRNDVIQWMDRNGATE